MGIKDISKRLTKFRVVSISIILGLLFALICITINNLIFFKNKVNIYLIGSQVENATVNTDYLDKGIIVNINNKNIPINEIDYSSKNDINPFVLGNYSIEYEIKINKDTYKLIRNINVVDDIKPVITTNDSVYKKFVCGNEVISNFKYTATDNYDGVLTDKVSIKEENNNAILSVKDSSGNESELIIPVDVSENNQYKLELEGKEIIYLPIGGNFSDPGVKVTNGCGNVVPSSDVSVSSNLNNSKMGNYSVTYSLGDSKVTRTIVVYNKVNSVIKDSNKTKVVYLTFDDGPGQYTEELLNILDKYNVKATFFVTNQFGRYVPLISEEHKRGHKVAVHTLTHNWTIYRSVENYMKDFNDMNNIIESYTGSKSKLFRFPGGSSNTVSKRYASGVVSAIASKMNSLGYVYFDWNVDSEDAAGANREKIVKNVTNGINKRNYSVVLMHDIKKPTLDAIEEIIVYCINNGFVFDVLTENSPTVHHSINN